MGRDAVGQTSPAVIEGMVSLSQDRKLQPPLLRLFAGHREWVVSPCHFTSCANLDGGVSCFPWSISIPVMGVALSLPYPTSRLFRKRMTDLGDDISLAQGAFGHLDRSAPALNSGADLQTWPAIDLALGRPQPLVSPLIFPPHLQTLSSENLPCPWRRQVIDSSLSAGLDAAQIFLQWCCAFFTPPTPLSLSQPQSMYAATCHQQRSCQIFYYLYWAPSLPH